MKAAMMWMVSFFLGLGVFAWWFLTAPQPAADSEPIIAQQTDAESATSGEMAARSLPPVPVVADEHRVTPATTRDAQQVRSSPSPAQDPMPAVTQATPLAMGGIKVSAEEARWLLEKGFPLEEHYQRLVSSTDEELQAWAAQGDLAARALLGSRMSLRRQTAEAGLELLHQTAADGSIFALHELANILRGTDPVSAAAYLRIATALGDPSLFELIEESTRHMSSEQRAMVDFELARKFSALNSLSVSRRGRPLTPQFRPVQIPPGL